MVRVVARRREGYTQDVEIEGGHTIVADEPVELGGNDAGPAPTRLLAASLAACTATTIEMYAGRKGWPLEGIEVEVEMDYTGPVPDQFTVTVRLPKELTEEQRERIRVIATKCPVHRALSGGSQIEVREEIEPV